MKRETRANMWFLIVFVIVSAPGAVLLFHKKLDPASPRLDEPDPVLTRLPYMTPLPAPPGIKWIVPSKTMKWLRDLKRSNTGSADVLSALNAGPEWEPIISSDHRVQLIGITPIDKGVQYELLLWSMNRPPLPDSIHVDIVNKSFPQGSPANVIAAESVIVPSEVRHELVSLGYSHPPGHVIWVEVSLSYVLMLPPLRINVECTDRTQPLHTWIDFSGRGVAKTQSGHDEK